MASTFPASHAAVWPRNSCHLTKQVDVYLDFLVGFLEEANSARGLLSFCCCLFLMPGK